MTLRGSLAKLQRTGAKSYLKFSEVFQENNLIRDTWVAMAQDLEQQAASLKTIPLSFWRKIQKEEQELQTAVATCVTLNGNHEERSLNAFLVRTLDFEEPVTLKVYAPLIHRLRTEWTDHALDFYVIVQAHLTRIQRLIKPFSGDPQLIHRCIQLLEGFEREVQAGPAVEVPAKKKARSRKKRKVTAARKKTTQKKAAARRKSVKKKAAARKKTTQKKAAARGKPTAKRAVARKKTAARKKKVTPKKAAARKKATLKKAAARPKKTAARRKTAARPARKTAARKGAARKPLKKKAAKTATKARTGKKAAKRRKPLVKKIGIRRSRARR